MRESHAELRNKLAEPGQILDDSLVVTMDGERPRYVTQIEY